MSDCHLADTGLFAAIGRPSNDRYQSVETFARSNGITFLLPERVYEELTVDHVTDDPPVEQAITDGWVRVAEPPTYHDSFVSRAMDGVRRYIANADDRPADEVERADSALAGVAADRLTGPADHVYVYTTDIAAGEAIETVFASDGYGESVTFVNGFRFVEDLPR
ncbi:MAG: hypothetical protein ABEI99_11440 [Halobaculum sp.]